MSNYPQPLRAHQPAFERANSSCVHELGAETHSDHAVARGVDQAGGFTQAEGADLPEFEHQITMDVGEHQAPIYLLNG
jgi:hypothetical protein